MLDYEFLFFLKKKNKKGKTATLNIFIEQTP